MVNSKKRIDSSALNDYLTYTYIPAPKTIFKDSKKLSPAHYLIYDGNKILVREYWDFDFSKKIKASEEFYSKKIYELLKDSVKRRLKGVKNPAVLLSGGLDSSSIAALASLVSKKQVKTFSIGFKEKSYNELDYARIIAKHFNTVHHEFYVKSTDVKKILPKQVMHQTLMAVLDYLEYSGKIVFHDNKILWTFKPKSKLKNEKGLRVR